MTSDPWLYLLRHLLSVLILPVTVTVIVPLWIAANADTKLTAPRSLAGATVALAGAACLLIGLSLFFASLQRFAGEGRGTLAPWDPPRNLVVSGPYRYVRNPMISGVIVILVAEALLSRSWHHAQWAALFTVVNAIYIPLLEEPLLERRFGDEYRRYVRNVPRLIPRLRPWRPD
jgi:protein-S-isoprenylcysteine O-methyltransferase Ste14